MRTSNPRDYSTVSSGKKNPLSRSQHSRRLHPQIGEISNGANYPFTENAFTSSSCKVFIKGTDFNFIARPFESYAVCNEIARPSRLFKKVFAHPVTSDTKCKRKEILKGTKHSLD